MRSTGYSALAGAAFIAFAGLPAVAGDAPPMCFGKQPTIIGTPGDDKLMGTNGDDVIYGDGGSDTIRGRGGDDRLCGAGDNFDRVLGNEGADRINGGSGADLLYGGQGGDVLRAGGQGSSQEIGERMWGGPGNDKMTGTTSSEIFTPGPGKDRIRGGASPFDTLLYVSATNPVKVDLRKGLARGEGSDVIEGIERVAGSRHDDILLGNGAGNHFVGNGGDDILSTRGGMDVLDNADSSWQPDPSAAPRGNDRLFGGNDNDWFTAGGGRDRAFGEAGKDFFRVKNNWQAGLDGGSGKDTLNLLRAGASKIDLRAGTGTTEEGAVLTLADFEVIEGSRAADALRGDGGRNVIEGDAGKDTIRGRGGDDLLIGGSYGANSIDGGAGNDTCYQPRPSQGATTCEN